MGTPLGGKRIKGGRSRRDTAFAIQSLRLHHSILKTRISSTSSSIMVEFGVEFFYEDKRYKQERIEAQSGSTYIQLWQTSQTGAWEVREWTKEGGRHLATHNYTGIHSITLFDPAQDDDSAEKWMEYIVTRYDSGREAEVCLNLHLIQGFEGSISKAESSFGQSSAESSGWLSRFRAASE